MELILLKAGAIMVAAISSFLFAMILPFLPVYMFFGFWMLVLREGDIHNFCRGVIRATWRLNTFFIAIPVRIARAIFGGGGENRTRH